MDNTYGIGKKSEQFSHVMPPQYLLRHVEGQGQE